MSEKTVKLFESPDELSKPERRRYERRRRRLLKRLARAYRLEQTGYFTDVEYGLIAIDCLLRLDAVDANAPIERWVGKRLEFFHAAWQSHVLEEGPTWPTEKSADVKGVYGDAAAALWDVARAIPEAKGNDCLFITHDVARLINAARRKLTRRDQVLGGIERRLSDSKASYPLLFSAAVFIAALIVTNIGTYLFTSRSRPAQDPSSSVASGRPPSGQQLRR